jgi:hypothetical protein
MNHFICHFIPIIFYCSLIENFIEVKFMDFIYLGKLRAYFILQECSTNLKYSFITF